jgi:hypothetical protein
MRSLLGLAPRFSYDPLTEIKGSYENLGGRPNKLLNGKQKSWFIFYSN